MSWVPRPLIMVLFCCASVALAVDVCFAHGYMIKSLEILHPAIAVPRLGSGETCAYVTIVNHGKVIERLTGLRTPVSDTSRITRLGDDGSSQLELTEIVIRPGERLNLRQAGLCLLLTGLKVQLEADVGAYPGTLIFDQAGAIPVEFMCDEYPH